MEQMIPIAYALYAISATLFLLAPAGKRNMLQEALPGWLLAMVFPIIGLYLAVCLPGKSANGTEPEPNDIQRMRPAMKSLFLQKVDKSRDMQVISLDDAILMNTDDVRRKLLMECLKGDAAQYVGVLKKALIQDDQETAHYAAAAMMELERRQTAALLEAEQAMDVFSPAALYESPEGLACVRACMLQTENAIGSELYDAQSVHLFRQKLSGHLERILLSGLANSEDHRLAIGIALDCKETEKALRLSRSFRVDFPDSEQAWLMELACTYASRDGTEFGRLLEDMKNSHVRFSRETLGLVRFWQKGQM